MPASVRAVTSLSKPPTRVWTSRPTSARGAIAMYAALIAAAPLSAQASSAGDTAYRFNDSHFHLTNYIQRGTDLRAFLGIMGSRVGRVALFGIPLQQQWSQRISGDDAPAYYLNTDAPLYYYSFTD